MMVGGVQWGLIAAFVVLFVPMVMAGWHLSRNKMLFFSGALFITLAVCVHLTPYFPSVSYFVSSVSSVIIFDSRSSCISLLHDIVWDVHHSPDFNASLKNNSLNYVKSWSWTRSTPLIACDLQKLTPIEASDLLNGSSVLVAGDSQARFLALSLLNLVLDSNRMESVRADLFRRHSNYQTSIQEIDMKLDFVWAPYASNLTDLMVELKQNRSYPDVLVMGSGLWHMLHFTNVSHFKASLESLRNSVLSLLPFSPELSQDSEKAPLTGSVSVRSPHMFWMGMPTLINTMLNTEEKRERMTNSMRADYDTALRNSKLLQKSGGPLLLLDVGSLSWNCGLRCTDDGMHYDRVVYEAAAQILLNALLIESHQRL